MYYIVKYVGVDGSSGFLYKAYKSRNAAEKAAAALSKRAWIITAAAEEVVF